MVSVSGPSSSERESSGKVRLEKSSDVSWLSLAGSVRQLVDCWLISSSMFKSFTDEMWSSSST